MRYLNKIIIVLLIFSLLLAIDTYAQHATRLDSIQGIWQVRYPGSPNSTEDNYGIAKGIKYLSTSYNTIDTASFSINKGYQGFVDFNQDVEDDELVDINVLRSNGNRFAFISDWEVKNGMARIGDFIIPSYFSMDKDYMEMGSSSTVIYSKIDNLPNYQITKLYYEGKEDKQDYIKEYLDIKVSEIKASKSILYSGDKKPTKIVLKQGEVVIIKEEKGDWIKIAGSVQRAKTKEELARDEKNKDFENQEVAKFIDEDFEGWVKKSDVK